MTDTVDAAARWEQAGVRLEVADTLATVTLCHPDRRNAQTPALWRALAEIGSALPGTVRVVLLRAEGVSFSAGLDRAAFAPEGIPGEVSFVEIAKRPDGESVIAEYQAGFTWWRRADLVTIAAVQGHAIGAGFQLALACDLRVVAEDVQFSMKETALGLVPDLTGTKPLVDLVGPARALEICGTGRYVHADEAVRLGLANVSVPRGELDAAARDLAAALLAAPRNALIETKALLAGAGARTLDEQSAAERAAQVRRLRDLAGIGD
ncbi:enoyl-CoA hydratase/isomerase family protein [Streptacidiphilus monticola]|uniref:Enoyl-CoA hydratase/isomerase family protein n=1 Tax=Streptacidiphilus monticola TaxID=2161674 RepID=A0ABW1FY48_9ACTN